MVASRQGSSDRCFRRMVALGLLVCVLVVSREMPSGSAFGMELLTMKLRWSIAWAGLQVRSPLSPLAAHLAVGMDPRQQSGLGRRAAAHLARDGATGDRLRWSAKLSRIDRDQLPLFIGAVQAALASTDCRLLRNAVKAARTLPHRDRVVVAREFGRHRFAHWGPTAIRAGLRVSNQAELRNALTRARQRPATRGSAASCAM
jgi:hypothetical protein